MLNKNDESFLFSVQLNWIGDTIGLFTAKKVLERLEVAAPVEFGGTEKLWSPEHFFLNAISGCFMTTYLAFSKKMGFEISGFNCEVAGQIEIVEGKYKFTHIDLFTKIFIQDEILREKAEKAIQKTQKYCLVANSVNAEIIYHSQVLLKTDNLEFQPVREHQELF
jgi:organic hydroperoxide reductase OsmC/OhrA